MARGVRKTLGLVLTLAVFLFASLQVGEAALRTYYRRAYPVRYGQVIADFSARNGLAPELVLAVIRTESGFRPDANSSVGARGIMQLTEETFQWVKSHMEPEADTAFADLYDPEVGIAYGSYLLAMLLREFGSVENALCAYHAGWGTAKRWLSDPNHSTDGRIDNIPYGDTDAYVSKVLRTMKLYRDLYPGL